MTAINFPSSPTNGQTFTVGNKVYQYDSTKSVWKVALNIIEAGGGGQIEFVSGIEIYDLLDNLIDSTEVSPKSHKIRIIGSNLDNISDIIIDGVQISDFIVESSESILVNEFPESLGIGSYKVYLDNDGDSRSIVTFISFIVTGPPIWEPPNRSIKLHAGESISLPIRLNNSVINDGCVYTVSEATPLPTGLSFSETGILSGSFPNSGVFTFEVTATNSRYESSTTNITLDISNNQWSLLNIEQTVPNPSSNVAGWEQLSVFTTTTASSQDVFVNHTGRYMLTASQTLRKYGNYDTDSTILASKTITLRLDTFTFSPNGMGLLGISAGSILVMYKLETAWDITSISNTPTSIIDLSDKYSSSALINIRVDKSFSSIFLKSDQYIVKFTLTKPYDIRTVQYDSRCSIYDSSFLSYSFSDGGEFIYISDTVDTSIKKLRLDLPWTLPSRLTLLRREYGGMLTNGLSADKFFVSESAGISFIRGLSPRNTVINRVSTRIDLGEIFSITSATGTVEGFDFSSDGSIITYIDEAASTLTLYTGRLYVPYDVSTIYPAFTTSLLSIPGFIGTSDTTVFGCVKYDSSGDNLYITSHSSGTKSRVYRFTLEDKWDPSSAIYHSMLDVTSRETSISGMFFKPDGSRLYVIGTAQDYVIQYQLSTPWDLTTAVFEKNSVKLISGTSNPRGLAFSSDGLFLYVTDSTPDDIRRYTLSTPWDVGSTTISGTHSVTSAELTPTAVWINDAGTEVVYAGTSSDYIRKLKLSIPFDIESVVDSSQAYEAGFSFSSIGNAGFFINNQGTSIFRVDSTDDLLEWELTTPWDLTTIRYKKQTIRSILSTPESSTTCIFIRADGLVLYNAGSTQDLINRYNLTTAWDMNTAVYHSTFNVSGIEGTPTDIWFSPDGGKMYLVGSSSDILREYALSEPWDITTAVEQFSLNVNSYDTVPAGLWIDDDGYNIYINGTTQSKTHRFVMSTPWDLSTAVFSESSPTLPTGSTTSFKLKIKPGGRYALACIGTNPIIREFDLR